MQKNRIFGNINFGGFENEFSRIINNKLYENT